MDAVGSAITDSPLQLENDSRLLAAFRAGERAVLERVYRANAPSIERYATALIGSRAVWTTVRVSEVADLVQEVFIRAFSDEARQAYDGAHDYRRYLGAIARNCFIDALRVPNREIPVDPSDLLQEPHAPSEPEPWEDSRIMSVLDAYVRGLPEALRRAYVHRFIGERSQEQTACDLGISRKAVRLAEQRLRAGLSQALVRAGIPLRG
jgi:RNA polymerase sigma factor (sigma-70 family)